MVNSLQVRISLVFASILVLMLSCKSKSTESRSEVAAARPSPSPVATDYPTSPSRQKVTCPDGTVPLRHWMIEGKKEFRGSEGEAARVAKNIYHGNLIAAKQECEALGGVFVDPGPCVIDSHSRKPDGNSGRHYIVSCKPTGADCCHPQNPVLPR